MRRTAWLAKSNWLSMAFSPSTPTVEWNNRPYEAIIQICPGQNKADIVVKATRSHDDLRSVIFTPTDWHLVRKCPTPVVAG